MAEIKRESPYEPGMLAVGQPFTIFPVPDGTIGFYPDAIPMMVVIGIGSPIQSDLDAFHMSAPGTGNGGPEGWIEFALVPLGQLLVTMIRFPVKATGRGWGHWMETPWSHRKDSWFDLEPLETTDDADPKFVRYGISCCLVDSDTNLVLGLRFFTLSPHYSQALHRELGKRLSAPPITPEEYVRLVQEYQTRYQEPKQLLDKAIVRCKAGLPGK